MISLIKNVRNKRRELETAKNAAANQLKRYLGEAEAGTVGDRRITKKPQQQSLILP